MQKFIMESKLKELIGQPNIWLYVESSNGWLKNVEIQEVNSQTLTFRYEQKLETTIEVWERTTRITNISEIDIPIVNLSAKEQALVEMRDKLNRLWKQNEA